MAAGFQIPLLASVIKMFLYVGESRSQKCIPAHNAFIAMLVNLLKCWFTFSLIMIIIIEIAKAPVRVLMLVLLLEQQLYV